jgi:ribosomal protein S18 acetylase RimI-like enzyme
LRQIAIRPVKETDLESLRNAINSVCREKWYIATVEEFSMEQSQIFLQHIIDNSWPQVVAEIDRKIVGWCDIIPKTTIGFTHVGHLGMGVRQGYRGKGIGRRLLVDCLSLARMAGIERVELEVFSDNAAAIYLYERHGFTLEGRKTHARKLEGKYQDVQLMALSLSGNDGATLRSSGMAQKYDGS